MLIIIISSIKNFLLELSHTRLTLMITRGSQGTRSLKTRMITRSETNILKLNEYSFTWEHTGSERILSRSLNLFLCKSYLHYIQWVFYIQICTYIYTHTQMYIQIYILHILIDTYTYIHTDRYTHILSVIYIWYIIVTTTESTESLWWPSLLLGKFW